METILVIDPNAGDAVALCKRLRSLGYRAMACVSTPALAELSGQAWDLVITEWDFYHLQGGSHLAALKPWSRPVLVRSSREAMSIAAAALEEGVRGVFAKKNQAGLVEEVRRILRPA